MSVLALDILKEKKGFTLDLKCEVQDRITGIFGPSGAGKTTLLRMIAGLEKPDRGYITIGGKKFYDSETKINLPPEKRNIGYVFQEGRLFPHLKVIQNLKYGIRDHSDKKLFDEISTMLKINDLLYKRIDQISGGQAQRVAIGRALLSSPELLVLDEPFSALDKKLRQHIIVLLRPLINKYQIPMLIVSHDLTDLLALTSNLLLIRDGKCSGLGNYYELMLQKEAMDQMSKSGLMNVIDLQLKHVDNDRGVLFLTHGKHEIYAESRLNENGYLENHTINVMLRPEDITLARHRIVDISIQNQLEGIIEKLIVTENRVLCVVDHGFKLIAEVTLATMQQMKMKEGDMIWSLFKAAAVKTNSKGIVNSRI